MVTLLQLAARGPGAGRGLHLQHRWARRAELTKATLEVLIQVAVENRVQATAEGKNRAKAHTQLQRKWPICWSRSKLCPGAYVPVRVAQGDAEVPGDSLQGGAGDADESSDDDEDVDGSPTDDEDGNHHQDHACDATQVPVLFLWGDRHNKHRTKQKRKTKNTRDSGVRLTFRAD